MRAKARLLAAGCIAAVLAAVGSAHLMAELPQTRTISLHNIHTDETVTVEYKRNGQFVPDAMQRIDWVMRDWRKNQQIRIEPALVDLLWEMHTELGSKVPIDVICGYRSHDTNEMLRKTVGGQASQSRHILGKAADVQFPDVPLKLMRYAALVRERGGVGYYPTSGTPFVHVDIDRVRAWPRLPRYELALLFPNGHTQHMPAEGGPITADDARIARSRYHDLAVQVAEFHDIHVHGRPSTTLVADAGPPPKPASPKPYTALPQVASALLPAQPELVPASQRPAVQRIAAVAPPTEPPTLVSAPRPVDRPARLAPRPSDEDRRTLGQLAALASVIPTLVALPAPAARPQRPEPARRLESLAALAPAAIGGLVSASAAGEGPNPRLAFASASASDALTGWGNGFAPAPAFDDDHPEEISYRPFPLAPFMTATASADDADLVRLLHPDQVRAVEQLDQTGSVPPMRLKPLPRVAQLMWAQQFSDDLAKAAGGDAPTAPAGLAEHRVRTASER